MHMEIVRLIGIIVLAMLAVFCLRRIVYAILNIRALNAYRHDANPLNQHQGIVLNKKTRKLEADQSPVLPFD